MRAGGLLLSLLIVVAIIFYLSFGGKNGGYVGTVAKKGGEARQESQQISGHADDGTPVMDQIKLEPVEAGGEFRRLRVTTVDPGSPWETVYGLKVDDEITEVGGNDLRMFGSASAPAQVQESYQNNATLTVRRGDQVVTLPPDKSALSQFQPSLRPKQPANPGGAAVPTH